MNVKNKYILPECKIVIIKISNGTIISAHPCEMCKKLLNKYKLNNIHTIINDKIVKII